MKNENQKITLKDTSYCNLQGWMITRLGLSGIELIIYATIYGFSDDGVSVFQGTAAYLAAWCDCSLRSVQRALKALQDRGLIEQVHHSADNRNVFYRANTYDKLDDLLTTNCHKPCDKTSQVLTTNCHKPYDKMSQDNNLTNNINNNLADNLEREGKPRTRFSPPTIEEVKDYAKERNGSVDPVRFFEYYTSNGWMVGKNKMKDWKAAFRNWETREKDETSGGSSEPVPYMQKDYKEEIRDHVDDLDDLLGNDGE